MRCWEWGGGKTTQGYGTVRVEGMTKYVHRITYEAIIGPIPAGCEIDHICRNPPCYNPEHLEAITHLENMGRRKHARKTHCPKGHLYSGDNLIVGKQTRGTVMRKCRACRRASSASWRASPRYKEYRVVTKEERMEKQRAYRARKKEEA